MNLEIVTQIVLMAASGLVSLLFALLTFQFNRLTKSVEDLNVKIAVVVERLEQHEKRLYRLEKNGG